MTQIAECAEIRPILCCAVTGAPASITCIVYAQLFPPFPMETGTVRSAGSCCAFKTWSASLAPERYLCLRERERERSSQNCTRTYTIGREGCSPQRYRGTSGQTLMLQGSTSGRDGQLDSSRECHVKWKGKSYMHCSWVPYNHIDRAAKLPLLPASTRGKLKKSLRDTESARVLVRHQILSSAQMSALMTSIWWCSQSALRTAASSSASIYA